MELFKSRWAELPAEKVWEVAVLTSRCGQMLHIDREADGIFLFNQCCGWKVLLPGTKVDTSTQQNPEVREMKQEVEAPAVPDLTTADADKISGVSSKINKEEQSEEDRGAKYDGEQRRVEDWFNFRWEDL